MLRIAAPLLILGVLSLSSVARASEDPIQPPDGKLAQLSKVLNCDMIMEAAGMLSNASDELQKLANMVLYLQEFTNYHKQMGSQGWLVSSEAISNLKSQFGVGVSFTTFSRELTKTEHALVADEIMGVLSNIPSQQAMIMSGGTAGERTDKNAFGGGVGIAQTMAMSMDFPTLSITATQAAKYKAALAKYIHFVPGGFGAESHVLFEHSDVLILLGGGGQAAVESLKYTLINPKGLLIIIDIPGIGGSAKTLLEDNRFRKLTEISPNIVVVKSGSEAGALLTERLGLRQNDTRIKNLPADKRGLNFMNPNADFHQLLPNSKIIGYSGWSNFDKALPDALLQAKSIGARIEKALQKVHAALTTSDFSMIYATAGNDPKPAESGVIAFESMVHKLNLVPGEGKFLALTSKKMNLNELNSKIRSVAYIADDWQTSTYQLPARVDIFVTSGGNQTVIQQAEQMATLKRPHLHILGANTLTDMTIERLKSKNPYLVTMTPEELEAISIFELQIKLGVTPKGRTINGEITLDKLRKIPEGTPLKIIYQISEGKTETLECTLEGISGTNFFVSTDSGSRQLDVSKIQQLFY